MPNYSLEPALHKFLCLVSGNCHVDTDLAEWHKIVAIAQETGLGGYLYDHLNKANALPDSILEELKKQYFENIATSLLAERVYKKVEEALNQAGISLMPMKGMVFRYLLYGEPATRPAIDIDLLVQEKDFESAHSALLRQGFSRNIDDPNRIISLQSCFERLYTHPEHRTAGTIVELHQGFSQRSRYDIRYDELWSRAITPTELIQRVNARYANTIPFGPNVVIMTPEDALVHQFIHNSIHMFDVPARAMLDAKLIIERWRPDWNIVLDLIYSFGVRNGAYLTLGCSKQTFGTMIPDEVMKELKPSPLIRKWLEMFVSEVPVRMSSAQENRLSFFRYGHNRRLQQTVIGLALIDNMGRRTHFLVDYLITRIVDFAAVASRKVKSK